MSRDAVLAVARCADMFGFLYAEQVSLNRDYLTDAQAACDEAKLQVQVEADAAPEGLELALLKLAVDLGAANLDMLSGTFGLAQQETLQAAVDEFVAAWG